ncbi:MAG: hypothetical protein J7L57_02740 [Deltaproteobacteria bacterium]|nr:hypothetical protein [Candidatus Tharpella sp.]
MKTAKKKDHESGRTHLFKSQPTFVVVVYSRFIVCCGALTPDLAAAWE